MEKRSLLDKVIVVLCLIWIGVLFESTYFERDVLALHILQSLIYVAVIFLSLRHSKWGYGIGISIAALWNAYNTKSGFVFNAGFHQWHLFLTSGHITNPVQFVAPIGYFAHVLLIGALLWAYIRLREKSAWDPLILLGSLAGTFAYFLACIALTWPQFIPRMRHLLGI
jgi:hypothetical protein